MRRRSASVTRSRSRMPEVGPNSSNCAPRHGESASPLSSARLRSMRPLVATAAGGKRRVVERDDTAASRRRGRPAAARQTSPSPAGCSAAASAAIPARENRLTAPGALARGPVQAAHLVDARQLEQPLGAARRSCSRPSSDRSPPAGQSGEHRQRTHLARRESAAASSSVPRRLTLAATAR